MIEAHGFVHVQRISENKLLVKVELRGGDPKFTYMIDVFEAGSECGNSDFGATGVLLRADHQGNGFAEVVLQLPYAPPKHHTLGDGKGTEAIIVVLDWIDAQKGGDRFSTDALVLPESQ